jgi:uncharacterized membrane protein
MKILFDPRVRISISSCLTFVTSFLTAALLSAITTENRFQWNLFFKKREGYYIIIYVILLGTYSIVSYNYDKKLNKKMTEFRKKIINKTLEKFVEKAKTWEEAINIIKAFTKLD